MERLIRVYVPLSFFVRYLRGGGRGEGRERVEKEKGKIAPKVFFVK